ncbi:pentatricopeptide repeat-containing protein At4g01030, mitochondrial-like [Camellia sinensis]|uniref:pentatricopeptide repeat-containing protein At4g01030, mitochondrial-like n=1 Tax=Camellia sinensis TaxID=4442 RepID=UPI001036E304|nr:pentatricopeptide repeat-containing protein At4g01030, mitochondrial-like [Camellia sinensis]
MVKDKNSDTNFQSLITSYLNFGDFRSAATVFFVGFSQNYLRWNVFVEEFRSFGGYPFEILEVFVELHNKRVSFDCRILTAVFKICANLMDIWLGMEVHGCLIKRGFEMDVYSKCAWMNFYGRCWGTDYASQMFDEMPDQEVLLWNEVVLVNLRSERWVEALQLFRDMQFSFVKVNSFTLAKVLQACAKLEAIVEGKQIHGAVFDSMENRNLSSWNMIISCYTTLGNLNDAWKLLHDMEGCDMKPDIVTWNSLLSGHFLCGLYREVLILLRRMQVAGFKPNSSSITSVLEAISELSFLNLGKEIHSYVIRNGPDYDVYVGTSLLDMYVKNNNLTYAQAVFNGMKNRNVFAWNSLISGYSFKGQFKDAVKLLNQMDNERIKPDLVTYNGLVSGYSMWGHNKEALAMIHQIKVSGLIPNVVTWTALISGCAQKGNYKDALEFSIQMQGEGIRPNSATISSLLQACAGLSSLQNGKEIHCVGIRNSFTEDVFVTTALIDMYSKCGSLNTAHEVFRTIQRKTLASWNCMIMGFAIYSRGKEAISIFDEMRAAGVQPDAITFTALLSGCKHSGLINEGWKYFDFMKADYNIIPTIEHYSCMVDLLGRAAYLDEAWDFIETMPMLPEATVWCALLGSCQICENLELAERAAKRLFKFEPHNPANYVLMMNSYATLNRWEDTDCVRELMMDVTAGAKIGHAWSWIQINQMVHMFYTRGKAHPDEGEIYFELYQLISQMKRLGYVPDIKCVYQNIDHVEKEKVLLTHTEKLTSTYGLIKMRKRAPIQVIKNTRVCSDCHTVAKYISLIRCRKILLRDGVRFHHFGEGKCSCNDFW